MAKSVMNMKGFCHQHISTIDHHDTDDGDDDDDDSGDDNDDDDSDDDDDDDCGRMINSQGVCGQDGHLV